MAMAPEPANSPLASFGWYDRRVADGDVPENIRSIAGWKRAIREFMSKDAKLNDVVMLFTQKFVQMGQSKNFTLSTIMDLAWTVLIITWEAVVDQKLPQPGEGEGSYKLRYEELKRQLFKIREEFLKEITQARDERRKRQGHTLQVAFNEIGEMDDQDVFHFMPEEGLDPQTREYFKAAMQENLKMALARGAAAAEEEATRIAKALATKEEECKALKVQLDTLEEKIEGLEIELQDANAVKPPPAPIRRSTSNNIKREVSKPTHTHEEVAAMMKQMEAAKAEEARLLEQLASFKEALRILGVDGDLDNLTRQQLQHMAKEKMMRSTTRADSPDEMPPQIQRRNALSLTQSPLQQQPSASPPVDPAALKAAEAEVKTLKQQQTENEAVKRDLKGQVTNLERELEQLKKDMEVQKEQTAIAQREANRNSSLLAARLAEQAQEHTPKLKTKKDSSDKGGSEAKSSSSSEKPQKQENKKKTGLPPPDSAPVVDVRAVRELEAKCKSLEQQVSTLQAELKVERAAVAAAQAELKSRPPPPPPPAAEPRREAQAAPAAAPVVSAPTLVITTAPEPPAVVEEPKPKVVVETRIVEVAVPCVEEPPPPSAPVMGKLSASGPNAEQKKLQKELQTALEQVKSLEQAAVKEKGRTSLVEVELEKSRASVLQLSEQIEELKGQLQETKLMKEVIDKAMNDLTEKFNEMRAKLEEKGVDVSAFDAAVAETGIKSMINAGTLVFDRLYRDALDRRQGVRSLKRHKRGEDRNRNNVKKVLRPHVTELSPQLSPLFSPDASEVREGGSSDEYSESAFGLDSEEADGDAAAGGRARSRRRWVCPNCGWASGTKGSTSGMHTASPSRALSKQSGHLSPTQQSGHLSPTQQARALEAAADYDTQQEWSDHFSPQGAAALTKGGGGFLPSFLPFPERSPSRRKPQGPAGGATSPGVSALTSSSGNLTPIRGRVQLAAGRSPLTLPDAASSREEMLALIFGGRDPTGLSIVSSGRGTHGDPRSATADPTGLSIVSSGRGAHGDPRSATADPNDAGDLHRAATQPWNAKHSKEPLPTRPVHMPSERIYVQSGGQQVLMSQPEVGVEPPSELHPLQVRALSPDSALRSTTFEFPGKDMLKTSTSPFSRSFTASLPPRRASRERAEPRQPSVPLPSEVRLQVAAPDEAGGPSSQSPPRSLTPGSRRRNTLPQDAQTQRLPFGDALPSISAGILHQDNLVFVGSPKSLQQSARQQLLAQLASAQLSPAQSGESLLQRRPAKHVLVDPLSSGQPQLSTVQLGETPMEFRRPAKHVLIDPLSSGQPHLSTVQLGETPTEFRRPIRSRLLEHLADARLGSSVQLGIVGGSSVQLGSAGGGKQGSLSPPHPPHLAPLLLGNLGQVGDASQNDPQSPRRGRAQLRMLRPETAPSLGSPERSLRRQYAEQLGLGVHAGLAVTSGGPRNLGLQGNRLCSSPPLTEQPWQQLLADGVIEHLSLSSRLDQTAPAQLQLGTAQLGSIERSTTPPTHCSPLAPLLTSQADASKRETQSQKGRTAHSRMLRSETAPSLSNFPGTPEKPDRLSRMSRLGLRQDIIVTSYAKNRPL